MEYRTYRPGPPLADFVEYMWALRDQPVHSQERIVPSGTLELVVNVNENALHIIDSRSATARRYSGAVVSGAYRRYFVIDTRDHAWIVGVHFRPGGALAVLAVPPGELADRHVDLETLWGRCALELRERLCTARSTAESFAVLEDALRSRLPTRRPGHPAVPFALKQLAKPGAIVGDIAARLELSRRRFIEVFTAEVGMTPKTMNRVLRFQRANALARRDPTPDWGRLAVACGYFDQSHLIRDVREFAGTSPSRLGVASEHVKEQHLAVPAGVNFLQYANCASS